MTDIEWAQILGFIVLVLGVAAFIAIAFLLAD